MLPNQKKFIVPVAGIGDFLGLLDPNESAMITYRGYPHDDYIVELSKGTNWDPGFDCLYAPGVTHIVSRRET
jgi:hypothetical protein